jgi:diketogulonate reductase-like aldo/keto reductase
VRHLEQLELRALRPDVLQVEIHPYLVEQRLTAYCAARGISVMAHTAFAHGRIWSDAALARLAARAGATVGQLVLAWHHARGVTPIISSGKLEHLRDNATPPPAPPSVELVAAIEALDRGTRICNDPAWAEF